MLQKEVHTFQAIKEIIIAWYRARAMHIIHEKETNVIDYIIFQGRPNREFTSTNQPLHLWHH